MSLELDVRLTGVDGVLDLLKSLPPELVSKRGGPVKSALRKAARVIHKQARANLEATLDGTDDEGARYSTGLLVKNLVVTRGKPPTAGKGERYLVRVRRKSYPDRSGATVTTLKTAQIKEYGSEKQTATPWLRPAASSRASEAINTATAELVKQLDRVVKRQAAKARAR